MIKRGTKNSVLVELEKIGEDEYQFSSGLKLIIPNYAAKQQGEIQLDVAAHNQRIYGECVAVPEILTKGDMVKFDTEDIKFIDSIEPEVRVGDRVYFSYTSVNKASLVEYEGKMYCNINYSAILCVVRNGVTTFDPEKIIIPIGGNILCEEYWGRGAIHTEVDGKKVFGKVSSSGLVTDVIKNPSQKEAIVRIVGSPLKGDEIEVQPGDLITFPNKFGFKNNIEGTDYLFIKYWEAQIINYEHTGIS